MKTLNKYIRVTIMIALLITLTVSSTNASTINKKSYKCRNLNVSGNFSKNDNKQSYRRVVTSYKQLNKLKKSVKKNYNKPKKYLKILNKYNRKYFRKNALVFVTEDVDMNCKEYKFSTLEKKKNKLIVNVGIKYTLPEGFHTTTDIHYAANTYFINIKKLNIKAIKKTKVKYYYIDEDSDSQ